MIVVVPALALVVIAAGSFWALLRYPLAVDAWRTRRALRSAGLVRERIETPAGRMTVWRGGAGSPLLLLHGAGDHAGTWSAAVPDLLKRYRIVVPDLPGHGESEPARGPLGIGTVLAGVETVLREETTDGGAIVVGNSLGAWIACLLAQRAPDRVNRLVLVNGGPSRAVREGPSLQPRNRAEARRLMTTLMGPEGGRVPWFVLDAIVRRARSGPIARLAMAAEEMERSLMGPEELAALTMPVELVWGTADGLFSPDVARRLQEALPRARFHPIEGCGHVPQRQCPRAFVAALLGVLDEEERT